MHAQDYTIQIFRESMLLYMVLDEEDILPKYHDGLHPIRGELSLLT